MIKNRELLLYPVLIVCVLGIASCRPRTNRSKTTPPPSQTTTTQPDGSAPPTAQTVLSRTDSAIQRVAALNSEGDDVPPVAVDESIGSGRSPSYTPSPSGGDYDVYQAGLAAYNGGQFEQAIGSFSQVALSGRPPELVPNAYYWMGESYFSMQRYSESLPYFEYVTKAGPEYKRQASFYKLALANDNLGNRQAANLWYERLNNEYPGSSYSKKLAARGLR